MHLDFFNASYSAAEDRILFQAVGDGISQNYWLTRRAALMLGEGIQKVLMEQCTKYATPTITTENISEVLSFERECAALNNPPKTEKQNQLSIQNAMLLFQISYRAEDVNYCVIQLTDQNLQGHCYRLTRDMLHALLNLIQSQCDHAGWGIRMIQQTTTRLTTLSPQALH